MEKAYAQYGFVCAVTRARDSRRILSMTCIHVVENGNESVPLGQWSSFLRSPYFFQLLIQIDRASLFCIHGCISSRHEPLPFRSGLSPRSSPPLLSFVFVFIFVSFLLLFVLHFQGNDSLWLAKTLEFFACRNHGPMRKRWI